MFSDINIFNADGYCKTNCWNLSIQEQKNDGKVVVTEYDYSKYYFGSGYEKKYLRKPNKKGIIKIRGVKFDVSNILGITY